MSLINKMTEALNTALDNGSVERSMEARSSILKAAHDHVHKTHGLDLRKGDVGYQGLFDGVFAMQINFDQEGTTLEERQNLYAAIGRIVGGVVGAAVSFGAGDHGVATAVSGMQINF